jgi:hypothetical protein
LEANLALRHYENQIRQVTNCQDKMVEYAQGKHSHSKRQELENDKEGLGKEIPKPSRSHIKS